MNKLQDVLGLTNLMLVAAGTLFGGTTVLSEHQNKDIWYIISLIVCLILGTGAVVIQIWAINQKLEKTGPITAPEPWPRPAPQSCPTEDDYKVSGHVQKYPNSGEIPPPLPKRT